MGDSISHPDALPVERFTFFIHQRNMTLTRKVKGWNIKELGPDVRYLSVVSIGTPDTLGFEGTRSPGSADDSTDCEICGDDRKRFSFMDPLLSITELNETSAAGFCDCSSAPMAFGGGQHLASGGSVDKMPHRHLP